LAHYISEDSVQLSPIHLLIGIFQAWGQIADVGITSKLALLHAFGSMY